MSSAAERARLVQVISSLPWQERLKTLTLLAEEPELLDELLGDTCQLAQPAPAKQAASPSPAINPPAAGH